MANDDLHTALTKLIRKAVYPTRMDSNTLMVPVSRLRDLLAAHPAPETNATLTVDNVKMLRETLCLAQVGITNRMPAQDAWPHLDRLQRLIDQLDAHRPLGPDGKHGDRHTPTCGCDDLPAPVRPTLAHAYLNPINNEGSEAGCALWLAGGGVCGQARSAHPSAPASEVDSHVCTVHCDGGHYPAPKADEDCENCLGISVETCMTHHSLNKDCPEPGCRNSGTHGHVGGYTVPWQTVPPVVDEAEIAEVVKTVINESYTLEGYLDPGVDHDIAAAVAAHLRGATRD